MLFLGTETHTRERFINEFFNRFFRNSLIVIDLPRMSKREHSEHKTKREGIQKKKIKSLMETVVVYPRAITTKRCMLLEQKSQQNEQMCICAKRDRYLYRFTVHITNI